MATMFQSWSMFLTITALVLQLCAGGSVLGERPCVIWSSAGPVVQRGSSFEVYCTFDCRCKGSMESDHPPTPQRHKELNATTIYVNVVNLTTDRTYSCECSCRFAEGPCGIDISVGYPPDRPENISCINRISKDDDGGVVTCTWNKGRDTFLRDALVLWVRTASRNHTHTLVSSKGTESPSASFTVSQSDQFISVWVQAQNALGSVESSVISYTLSDIAMPPSPVLCRPDCSSRECRVTVEQSVRTQLLEIQLTADQQTWTTYPDSVPQTSSSQVRSIAGLEPYRLYHFRARSRLSTGLWSQWSASISSWTQEEAPSEKLDVWFTTTDFKSMTVYWKEANVSISRGRIIEYKVSVSGLDRRVITNTSADARNYSVPFCADCDVTVWSRNSRGLSPPATLTTRRTQAEPVQDVRVTAASHSSIAIWWRKPETAAPPTALVLEWFPEGHKLQELRWVRLGASNNQSIITGVKPFECYEGAVHVFYNESSVGGARFKGVATLESAPVVGPFVEEKVEGNKVKVTWTGVPLGQRGGCITTYTIYVESASGHRQNFSLPASQSMHTITNLPAAVYSLWMSASTAAGEGPAGQKVKFFIQQENPLPLLLVCVLVGVVLVLLCLWQISPVKQRFWECVQCFMLDVVPDPANSKWAKECTREKGNMNLQLPLSNSSMTKMEEETILVDVEELPGLTSDASSQLLPQTSLSPDAEPTSPPYPLTSYIKSFSHDSDSSDYTQTSRDTNTTDDYISSHGLRNMDEEDEEEDEEFASMHFFPSHNIFVEPLQLGGKLTLDAVKIDCGDFFRPLSESLQ